MDWEDGIIKTEIWSDFKQIFIISKNNTLASIIYCSRTDIWQNDIFTLF